MDCGQGLRWFLTGAWPRSHSGAWELIGRGTIDRGGHGEPLRRQGDGSEEAMKEALSAGSTRARREESGERCGGGRRGSPFYRGQGGGDGRGLRGRNGQR
jgi:hypothetical protein